MTYAEMLANWNSPMPVVAGPRPKPSDRLTASYLGEDQELLNRTKHVRLKKETILEFHARTGLGKSQIMTMTKDEITRFCEIAERNRKHELANDPVMNAGALAKFTPKPLPKKITVDDTPSSTSMFVGM